MTQERKLRHWMMGAGFALGFPILGASAQTPSAVVGGETIASPELVAAACKEGAVVFYTAQADADERAITRKFGERFPCVKISIISAVTGRLFERIQTEATAGSPQADVALLTDEALAEQLIEKKLVRQWTPPSDDKYGETAKRKGWWYAASSTYLYPVYNSDLVSDAEAPKSWKDLLDPKWKGQIGTVSVTLGGTGWMQYYFLDKVMGEDYLRKFVAQEPKVFTSYAPLGLGVARGEYKIGLVGLVVDYPLRVTQGAPIKPIYPVEGIPVANYPLVVINNSPHPKTAELFANWYLSKEGQSQLVSVRGTYSLRNDVEAAEGNPPAGKLRPWNPGNDEIVREYQKLIDTATRVFGTR
jgi:iron(III) transport system substrate-binding protein